MRACVRTGAGEEVPLVVVQGLGEQRRGLGERVAVRGEGGVCGGALFGEGPLPLFLLVGITPRAAAAAHVLYIALQAPQTLRGRASLPARRPSALALDTLCCVTDGCLAGPAHDAERGPPGAS